MKNIELLKGEEETSQFIEIQSIIRYLLIAFREALALGTGAGSNGSLC